MIRMVGLAAAVAVLTGGVLATGDGAADAAAPTMHVQVVQAKKDTWTDIDIYNADGQLMGLSRWHPDPYGSEPGDALRAYDGLTDGYAIYAYLSDGRVATTSGHNAPYWSPWVGPNLPEHQTYIMEACVQKSGVQYACWTQPVNSSAQQ